MAIMNVLFVSLLVLVTVTAQSCSAPVDNTAYDASGFIVTLYSITSAASCCAACSGFQESKSYSWAKDGSMQCTCTNGNSQSTYNSNSMGGAITSGYSRPALTCSTNLLVGLDYNNGAIGPINTYQTAAQCCAACQAYIGCNYYGYAAWGSCYMRNSNANPTPNAYLTSGAVVGPTPAPLRSGKRGIAWTGSYSCTDLQAMTNVAWIYNWGPQPDAPLLQCMQALGIEYIPMLWGIGSNWPISYLSTTSTHLLTYNEPNFSSQSALTPAQAAATWPQIQAFARAHNMKISSPSASTGGDLKDPIQWLDEFFAACVGCQVDFITTHIYTCYSVVPVLSQFTKYGLPIWVTEFSCPDIQNPAAVQPFMQQALAYMDSNPQFERYSWFGTRFNDDWLGPATSLFNNNGAGLSALGQFYNTPVSSISASSSASVAASASASTSGTASASISASASLVVSASVASSTASASLSSTTTKSASVSSSTSLGASTSTAAASRATSTLITSSSASVSASTASSVASTSSTSANSASVSASVASVSASTSASASVASTVTGSLSSVASTNAAASTSAVASTSGVASTSSSVSVASTVAGVVSSSASTSAAASTSASTSAAALSTSTTGSSVTYPPAPGVPTRAPTLAPTSAPSTTRPVTSQPPSTVSPTTRAATTTKVTATPVTTIPATTRPATTKPSTTMKLTTSAPTTARKTTSVPSTVNPTTVKLTTAAATTRTPTSPAPNTTASPTTVKVTSPSTTAPNPCGSASACGSQCYDASMYTCSFGVLCPSGMQSCGGACYSTTQYKCVSGSLAQL